MKDHVYVAALPACDICKEAGRTATAEYDGKTTFGPHAYMCRSCFARHGVGRGPLGQLLIEGDEPQLSRAEKRAAIMAALEDGDFDEAEDIIGDGDIAEWL